jgi:hypothetical protein
MTDDNICILIFEGSAFNLLTLQSGDLIRARLWDFDERDFARCLAIRGPLSCGECIEGRFTSRKGLGYLAGGICAKLLVVFDDHVRVNLPPRAQISPVPRIAGSLLKTLLKKCPTALASAIRA